MVSQCPKCGRKLTLRDLKPQCPGCKTNLLYYKIEERLEVDPDFIGDDKLLQLVAENRRVLGLDHAVDMTIDVLLENALDGHVCIPLDRCVDGVVHLEKSLDIEGTVVSPALLSTEQVK